MDITLKFNTQMEAFLEIKKLAETNPNDMDFGKKARIVINEFKLKVSKEHESENDGDNGGL